MTLIRSEPAPSPLQCPLAGVMSLIVGPKHWRQTRFCFLSNGWLCPYHNIETDCCASMAAALLARSESGKGGGGVCVLTRVEENGEVM